MKVGLHQGSALSPLLFITVMDVISKEVGRGPPHAMLGEFAANACLVLTQYCWLLGLCLRKESNTDEYDISTTR